MNWNTGQKKSSNDGAEKSKGENHEKEVQGWAGGSENIQKHSVAIPKGRARPNGVRLLFEKIMFQNFPELMKEVDS